MMSSLQDGTIDVAIALTESLIAGIASESSSPSTSTSRALNHRNRRGRSALQARWLVRLNTAQLGRCLW